MAIKQYHYFHTIKKYTKGLLDTFNDIQTERIYSDGKRDYKPVPITFASKDPAYLLSDMEVEQLLAGNTNFLPRMSLSIESTEPLNTNRGLNRMQYITLPNGDKKQFLYNSFGMEIMYSLTIEAKSMTELLEVFEQILPHFNPTLNLRVYELDNLTEPTSIKVEYMVSEINLPTTNEDHATRICSATIRLKLHGNIYPRIDDPEIIKYVKINMHANDKVISTLRGEPLKLGKFEEVGDTKLVLENVMGEEIDGEILLKPVIDDPEQKLFAVIYNIVYKEDYAHLQKQSDNSAVLVCDKRAIVSVQCIDTDGKQSNYMEVSIKNDNGDISIAITPKG